jgi:hypothetical protein
VANVKYIGPSDAVDVDGVGTVKRGETVSVLTVIAGRKPEARFLAACEELVEAMAAQSHDDAARLRDEIVGLDAGEGLLAQTAVWESVATKNEKGESK